MHFTIHGKSSELEPEKSGLPDLVLLFLLHGFLGQTEFCAAPVLYFDKPQSVFFPYDKIDLTAAAVEIVGDNSESFLFEKFARQRFTFSADRYVIHVMIPEAGMISGVWGTDRVRECTAGAVWSGILCVC